MKPREIWSFFSGALGLDLGFEQAGLAPTLAVELDECCCETIQKNRPEVQVLNEDVSRLNASKLRSARNYQGEVFLMIGGPPCQSFSPGGKRAGLSDPRGNLIYEYLRLIKDVRPQYFVFENVANLTTAALRHRKIEDRPGKHWNLKRYADARFQANSEVPALEADELSGSAIRQLLQDIDALGYTVNFGVLDSADYGAPQHRLRFVMLAARDAAAPLLPSPSHGNRGLALKPFVTVRDAIEDLRKNPGPHSKYTVEVREYFSLVPEGGNWRSLPTKLHKEALGGAYESGGGKTGFYRRLHWDRPAPTIIGRANRKGSALCHPEFVRPLSVRECARLQGFPDEWSFAGALNRQYMQVGNAVPIPLGHAVAAKFRTDALKEQKKNVLHPIDSDLMLENAVYRLRASARNKKSVNLGPTLFDVSV